MEELDSNIGLNVPHRQFLLNQKGLEEVRHKNENSKYLSTGNRGNNQCEPGIKQTKFFYKKKTRYESKNSRSSVVLKF